VIPTTARRATTCATSSPAWSTDGGLPEVQAGYAKNIVVGFAGSRGARSASSPTSPTSHGRRPGHQRVRQGARFIRFCNAFNIPLLTFVDVPGFMPGVAQEYGGIIRHGAKMLFAYSAATVPEDHRRPAQGLRRRLPRHVRARTGCRPVFAWPTAEIAVMGAEGAAGIVFRKEIEPGRRPGRQAPGTHRRVPRHLLQPVCGREHGLVDDVIDPAETRRYVARPWSP
jgi:methylmalonyl-CoA carboxyltransferase large subunit